MELTRKQAFELSIKKWEAEAKGEEIPQEILALKMKSNCGLCEKYCDTTYIFHVDNCPKCPINIIPFVGNRDIFGCIRHGHPYIKYLVNPIPKNAQKVLDLIKSKM